jgi:hypothetical protein
MSWFEHDSHTGDAVLIAPVSMQIPCKQGILQGIGRFWQLGDPPPSQKTLRYSAF